MRKQKRKPGKPTRKLIKTMSQEAVFLEGKPGAMMKIDGPPDWLVPGASVIVKGCSAGMPFSTETVSGVWWSWIVFLEGKPGGCHPNRVIGPAPTGK